MREIHRVQVQVAGAKSLIWAGGELVDVSAGWRPIPLDGSTAPSRFGPYGPQFDAATISPLGDVVVLMATALTGQLLTTGESPEQADIFH